MEKPSKRVLTLDSYQHGVVIHALNELRNDLIHEQRPTDIVDEVLVKTIDAPRASPGRASAGMNGKPKSVWYALGLLPAVWLGLLVAPAASGGLFGIIRQFPAAMRHPFHIIWCEDSGKAVLFFLSPPMACWWERCCLPGATTGVA